MADTLIGQEYKNCEFSSPSLKRTPNGVTHTWSPKGETWGMHTVLGSPVRMNESDQLVNHNAPLSFFSLLCNFI
jgi:hypothetical protein